MDEGHIHLLRDGYQYFVGHQGWRPYSHLLVKLEAETIRLIENLYLNNYEISEWQGYFLTLWSSQPDIDYISSRKLLTRLGVADVPIYDTFFSPFLILSMSNIKSNKLITDDQVLSFFRSLNLIQPKSCEIATWLNHVQRDKNGYISLSTFSDFVLRDFSLIVPLYTLKTRLIEIVIGENEFSTIIQRQKYYNEKAKNISTHTPSENCCNRINRFVTHRPPPLYYDYKPQSNSTIDLALYYLRTKFGYSVRPHRVSSASLSLSINKRRSLKNEISNSLCRDNTTSLLFTTTTTTTTTTTATTTTTNNNNNTNTTPTTDNNSANIKFSSQGLQCRNSLTISCNNPTTNTTNTNNNRGSNIIIPKKSVFESKSNRNLNSIELKCKSN